MRKLTILFLAVVLTGCSKTSESEFDCECEKFKVPYSINRPSFVYLRPCETNNLDLLLLQANTLQLETQSAIQGCD